MNKLNIDREKLIKMLPAIVGVALIVLLYTYFFLIPINKKIGELEGKISKVENDVSKAKEIMAKFNDLNKKLNELKLESIEMEKKLPREKNMPDLIKKIKQLADKNSIIINSISPSSTVKDRYFFRITYNMSVSGSYHNIGSFFADISLEERILNIENVLISGGNPSQVNFTLVSYQYNEGK